MVRKLFVVVALSMILAGCAHSECAKIHLLYYEQKRGTAEAKCFTFEGTVRLDEKIGLDYWVWPVTYLGRCSPEVNAKACGGKPDRIPWAYYRVALPMKDGENHVHGEGYRDTIWINNWVFKEDNLPE